VHAVACLLPGLQLDLIERRNKSEQRGSIQVEGEDGGEGRREGGMQERKE
jgi:hypothetical protein